MSALVDGTVYIYVFQLWIEFYIVWAINDKIHRDSFQWLLISVVYWFGVMFQALGLKPISYKGKDCK